jgi:hypothetical protein
MILYEAKEVYLASGAPGAHNQSGLLQVTPIVVVLPRFRRDHHRKVAGIRSIAHQISVKNDLIYLSQDMQWLRRAQYRYTLPHCHWLKLASTSS